MFLFEFALDYLCTLGFQIKLINMIYYFQHLILFDNSLFSIEHKQKLNVLKIVLGITMGFKV